VGRKLLILLIAAIVVAGLAAVGVATAARPTIVRAGNVVLKLNGGVAPKALPKRRLAPIALRISGNISTSDGTQPPAAKLVIVDFDKHGTVNARGLPVCRAGKLQARSTVAAKRACPKAIVGRGKTRVRVVFPEQAAFYSTGPLVLFNGGVRGGTTTMYIHAYVNVPAPTAIVTVVKIKRIHKGRLGTRAIARIPKIAGGYGSITRFAMAIKRNFRFRGRSRSYLSARCANGRFFAHADVVFAGGLRFGGTVVRPCRSKG
jgi:hypothetical protein